MGYYGANRFCGFNGILGIGGPMLMGLLLLVLIIVVSWFIVSRKYNSTHNKNSNAFEILQERLAKGEITHEEFRILKKELE